ncbi:hypothetical protein [Micromonospora sp. NPDC047730]|uniref:hypothetical protein n=1 Tax=Micromonospora sp. NPDC047730 TaxID=3364253 RepID=UPI003715E781
MTDSITRWQFELRAVHKMQSSNDNKHWSGTREARATWRAIAAKAADRLRMPKGLARIRVDIELVFPAKAKRDAPNYYQEIGKRIVDGLGPQRIVRGKNPRIEPGHGVVVDDTAKQVHGPNITISERLADTSTHPFGYAVVTVWDLSTPPPIPESGIGWRVVTWRDPEGRRWFRHGLDLEQFVDDGFLRGEKSEIFDSRTELEAAYGLLTPADVDDPAALLVDLHATQLRLAGYVVGGDA